MMTFQIECKLLPKCPLEKDAKLQNFKFKKQPPHIEEAVFMRCNYGFSPKLSDDGLGVMSITSPEEKFLGRF